MFNDEIERADNNCFLFFCTQSYASDQIHEEQLYYEKLIRDYCIESIIAFKSFEKYKDSYNHQFCECFSQKSSISITNDDLIYRIENNKFPETYKSKLIKAYDECFAQFLQWKNC